MDVLLAPFTGEQLEDTFGLISEHSVSRNNKWMEGFASGVADWAVLFELLGLIGKENLVSLIANLPGQQK